MTQIVSLFQAAIVFGTVILFGAIGEILAEKAGNLNLGVPGIMYLGGIAGLIGVFYYEMNAAQPSPVLCLIIALVCSVAVAMLFNFIFYPTENGILNYFLGLFGISPIGWLVSPKLARFSIVIMGLWRSIGYDTILFLAGLQSIPGEIYEAAAIDGASGLQKWWYITIPNMKPTFTFMIMMLTISTLRRFDDVWMIGGSAGNPAGKLDTMVMYIFRNSWLSREVGVASAAAVVLFVITMTLTILNNYVFNRKD